LLKIKNKLKQSQPKNKVSNFQLKNKYLQLTYCTNSSKCCTISQLHFASSSFAYNCGCQLREYKQKLHIPYL